MTRSRASAKPEKTFEPSAAFRSVVVTGLQHYQTYTIRQKSTGRFLDAHEVVGKDFGLVTRPAQNNDTQLWEVTGVGDVVAIQPMLEGRFLDAHETATKDFRLVTRPAQNNDTQRWVVLPAGGDPRAHTIRQLSSLRFVDAHEVATKDFRVITRPAQNNDSQVWLVEWPTSLSGEREWTFRQRSSGRWMNGVQNDFSVVTRGGWNSDQADRHEHWRIEYVGSVCTICQKSSGRFVDAHEIAGKDFRLVTRPAQNNDTQHWLFTEHARLSYDEVSVTIQQLSNGRCVDAHDSADMDFSVVTRPTKNNDAQSWILRRALP